MRQEQIKKIVLGIVLLFIAKYIASMPMYTLIKRSVTDAGGTIVLGVAVAWIIILCTAGSGILILKEA